VNKGSNSLEWRRLYDAVRKICTSFGIERTEGRGDFLVLDDDWGGTTQQIFVFNPEFLQPQLVNRMMEYLRTNSLFGVLVEVIVDFDQQGDRIGPTMGLVFDMDLVVEHWDRALLEKNFGKEFYKDR
jgi:hypothetical protein